MYFLVKEQDNYKATVANSVSHMVADGYDCTVVNF